MRPSAVAKARALCAASRSIEPESACAVPRYIANAVNVVIPRKLNAEYLTHLASVDKVNQPPIRDISCPRDEPVADRICKVHIAIEIAIIKITPTVPISPRFKPYLNKLTKLVSTAHLTMNFVV